MSESDAAPLPRLGEVFFDVRGNSRTMRLSWYSDTGIAVFSIWQGGRCTGTFRLPMEDLARMTEILQRGPQRRQSGPPRDYEHGDYQPAGHGEDHYGEGQYGEGQYGEGQYGEGQYDQDQYDQDQYGEDQYDQDWFGAESSRAGGRRTGERQVTDGYPDRHAANRPSAGHDSAGYERSVGYADSADYERSVGYADSQAGAGASDATGRYEFPARAVRPEDGGYPRGVADHDGGAVADLSGYGHERFVPPYVQSGGESYANDNPPAGSARRHGAVGPAYPADRAGISAEPDRYPQPPHSEAGYPGGSEYGLPADPGATAQYSAGRHSGRRSRSSPAAPFDEPDPGAAGEPISERDYWSRQAR